MMSLARGPALGLRAALMLLARGSAAATHAAAVPAPAAQEAQHEVARYAVVIGNNRADVAEVPTLRYADDDAAAIHRLLIEAGVDSRLLVRFDDDSRALAPQVVPRGLPRSLDIDRAFAAVFSDMKADRARGFRTELLVFYSGHGDVEHGEGYLALEDRRLTRSQLFDLLAHSPAQRNHVIIDACKSFFMVFDKGLGGARVPYDHPFVRDDLPAHLANTGFVLSTSSDRDSHEWERYQAGILSYEVRSALRGAADVDRDGRVTYAELGAFVATANGNIPNPRFRPDFLVQPPNRDLRTEVLAWEPRASGVNLGAASLGHVYLETPRGERLLDAHPAPGQPLILRLPADRPLFIRGDDEKTELVLSSANPIEVASLLPVRAEVARKGALHLAFRSLFAAPFGAAEVAAFQHRYDEERARQDTPEPPSVRRRRLWRLAAAPVAIAAEATALTLNVLALNTAKRATTASQSELPQLNRSIVRLDWTSAAFHLLFAGAGVTWLWNTLGPDEPRRAPAPIGVERSDTGATMLTFGEPF